MSLPTYSGPKLALGKLNNRITVKMKKSLYPSPELQEMLAVTYMKKNLKREAKNISVLRNIRKVLTNDASQRFGGIAK